MECRKKQQTAVRQILLYFFACTALSCAVFAQKNELSVPLKVSRVGLPITIGVPLSEAANVHNASQLTLLAPGGSAVPAQIRVTSRWQGIVADEMKAIKWVLLDFAPKVAGNYFLTDSGVQVAPASSLTVNQLSDKISVTSARLKIDFATSGSNLAASYKLDNVEQLSAPLSLQGLFPRSAIVVLNPTSSETLTVNETSLFAPGMQVHFEHLATLKWAVEKDWKAVWSADQQLQGNHRYLLDESTPQQEELIVTTTDYGTLNLTAPLKFNHPAGAKLRDLTIEKEIATIKSVASQSLTFTEPLKQAHAISDCLSADNVVPAQAFAAIEKTSVEEANALRVVIKQQGHFRISPNLATETASPDPTVAAPTLNFTIRYYLYADQPFVRVRVRLMNEGTYGFGATRLQTGPYTQHILLRSLSVNIPTVSAGNGNYRVTEATDAYAKVAAQQNSAHLSAGEFEIAVPEFAENFPKALTADNKGLQFALLPDLGTDYQFDGARAKTTDFYLGRKTIQALALTNSLGANPDPAYVARTGAVRPLLVEKRDWAKQFPNDAELAEAATRAEKMVSVGYAVEDSDSNWRNPAQSVFEYRLRDEMGANLGWRNFGDLAWAAGYTNVHYDQPYILLREFLRTGDARAFQLGSEMVRYRADWGQYHADDYWDNEHAYNMRGVAFYEKGDHGSDVLPLLTHNWIEGMWLHYALTGDEEVHESAVEGSEALARFLSFEFTADNALKWNESRWLGWPALGLMAAWRYTGDVRYFNSSRKAVYLLMGAEEKAGKKGWFIPETSGIGPITQPFMWAGYCQLGIIEYWRETGDERVANYIVRVADWLLGKTGAQPVLRGGKKLADGTYQPLGTELAWSPTRELQTPVTELAMLNLPVLTTAARITNRADFRATARQLFRDAAFYRDINEGQTIDPAFRAPLNFRAFQFGGNAPKVYGHTGLSMSEYLPDLVGALTLPRRQQASTNSLLDDASTRTIQVGQTLRVALKKVDADGLPLNLAALNLPLNAIFEAGELVFTPGAAQAGKLFQIGFTGTNSNVSLSAKIDVVVLADAPQVKLLAPVNGERLMASQSTMISWAVDTPSAIVKYELRLSTDGGTNYQTVLAELPNTATSFAWKVPESLAAMRRAPIRLMIVAIDNQNRVSLDFTPQDLQIAGTLAVVSAANYLPIIAPGSLCSGFGTKLAVPPANLEPSSSLYQRNGTTMEVLDSVGNYHRIPLMFADSVTGGSYDQVNFYLPEEVAPGHAVVTVTASSGEISQGYITVQPVAPAIFTADQTGKGEASVVATTDSINFDLGFARQDPNKEVFVSIFGTGWRFSSPSQGGKILNSFGNVKNFQAPNSPVIVELDGQIVEVLYAGVQPDYIGLDQINFRLPRDLKAGIHEMVVRVGDQVSNTVSLRVQ